MALTRYESALGRHALATWAHGRRYASTVRALRRLHVELGRPVRVTEIGCGVGRLWEEIRDRVPAVYSGVEIDESLAAEAERRHGTSPGFRVYAGDAEELLPLLTSPDVVVALETLEHVPACSAERIAVQVAASRPRLFLCSVPVEVGPVVIAKQAARLLQGQNREYTWPQALWAGLGRLDKLPPHTVWHLGFDWRRLVVMLREDFRVRVETLPVRGLPRGLATGVFLLAKPR